MSALTNSVADILLRDLESLIDKYVGREGRWVMNMHKNDLKAVRFKAWLEDMEVGPVQNLNTHGKPELKPEQWVGIYKKAIQ